MSSTRTTLSDAPMALTRIILGTVFFTFITYLAVGIPLAVLPGYVHDNLGFNSVIAGLVISSQYLATLLSRSYAGRLIDTVGAKQSVLYGMFGCGLSGTLMVLSVIFQSLPWVSLTVLLIGRIVLGCSESLAGTGTISWAIGRVGAAHTAKVISWNGVANYAALAIGAPLGVLLTGSLGLWSMGGSILAISLASYLIARRRPAIAPLKGERLPFRKVLGRVFPFGMGLALGGIGFGTLATFITLYYASRDWAGAALCLSIFGLFFICARLLFANLINRVGGFRVAIVSLAIEAMGLTTLWLAPSIAFALLGAALTGIGFSLVFPSLGVEAVQRVPAANRGAALGAYSIFVDLSLAITGPLIGAIAAHFDYATGFLCAALAATAGTILSIRLLYRYDETTRDQP